MSDKGWSFQEIIDFIILAASVIALLLAITKEISRRDNPK